MGILLAFAPFVAFALVDRLVGPMPGLIAGAVIAAALAVRDRVAGHVPKILEIGTFILFACLALYALLGGPTGSIIGVRLCVDIGLLLIVLLSIAIRRPFTLQYAREQVAPELWSNAEFLRTNLVITWVWALAFAVIIVADLSLLLLCDLPRQVGILTIVAALVGAIKFTGWYPRRQRPHTIG